MEPISLDEKRKAKARKKPQNDPEIITLELYACGGCEGQDFNLYINGLVQCVFCDIYAVFEDD